MAAQTASVLAMKGVPPPDLPEIDLDTGQPSRFGEYELADHTYADLLDTLLHPAGSGPRTTMPAGVRQGFLAFYSGFDSGRKSSLTEPAWYHKKPRDWELLQSNLQLLNATPPSSISSPDASK